MKGILAISYQLSAVSQTPRAASVGPTDYEPRTTDTCFAKATQIRPACAAFTLIEMVVVVAIIGLLAAIAIPVSTGLVKYQQRSSTLSTMQVLENAIATFASERPLSSELDYETLFGPFPPSPVSSFRLSNLDTDFAGFGPTGADKSEPGFVVPGTPIGGTKAKFERLIRTYLVPKPPDSANVSWFYKYYNENDSGGTYAASDPGWGASMAGAQDPYLSIETCVLFMRILSPKSRAILDKLSAKHLTNQVDSMVVDFSQAPALTTARVWWVPGWLNGTPPQSLPPVTHDLYKVLDAWGRPLRYSVQVPLRVTLTTGVQIPPRRWELRSAGPDGKFDILPGNRMPTFAKDAISGVETGAFTADAEEKGDDVILRGP